MIVCLNQIIDVLDRRNLLRIWYCFIEVIDPNWSNFH
jgi:hypothetical protein